MPYKDPAKAREAKRKTWQKRYDNDPAYRQAEQERVQAWKEGNEDYLAREREKRMERWYKS
ncbi:MAG TPA: hypothetical protein VGE29_16925 [Prosthecobacter sp.]